MKSKRLTWFVGFLAILIWGLISYKIYESSSGEIEPEPGLEARIRDGVARKHIPFAYERNVRDPFDDSMHSGPRERRASAKGGGLPVKAASPWRPPPFTLTGILTAKKKNMAILAAEGGSVFFLREGDTLSGIRILKIKERGVSYQYRKKNAVWGLDSTPP